MRQPGRRNKLTVKEIVNAIKWIIILHLEMNQIIVLRVQIVNHDHVS